jgi:hypothetical protein
MYQSMSRRVQVSSQSEDDIDRLFNHLGQLEPPNELVARILTHIGHLPELPTPSPSHPVSKREYETLVVHNEWRDPS